MNKILKIVLKYISLWLLGGITYYIMEIVYRGYSHWTMFILGGICFILGGLINELFSWETPLWLQSVICATIITILEFIVGCIINIWLGWNIWDYSELPLNILGQVSLPFFIIWLFIGLFVIVYDDVVRWIFFGEEKPHYKFF